MRLNKKQKVLLFSILKPWEPSDSWTPKEFKDYLKFYLDLCRSMDADGHDVKREMEQIEAVLEKDFE